MILPDKWGQGALFSYSGALGEHKYTEAFSARLCADKFAIVFDTDNPCTLTISADKITDVKFNCVMTDMICATLKTDSVEFRTDIIFAACDTVLVYSDYAVSLVPVFEKPVTSRKSKKSSVYTSGNETFAMESLKKDGTILYAFCYGKDACARASDAVNTNVKELIDARLNMYESYPQIRIPNDKIEKLYYRCISVLMGCVNSPEGIIKSAYITPSKGEMNGAYSYWSALCTLGMRHISPEIARNTLETLLAAQAGDGMISGRLAYDGKSNDINPPVLAWCFWELYKINGDKAMLSEVYNNLKKYLHYMMETRDINKNQLYEWQIGATPDEYGRESTRDNSPAFDDGVILDAVDFSSYVANEAAHMNLIAEEIDKHGEGLYWNVVFERIKSAMNDYLFDDDDKIYYDRAVVSNMFKRVKTSASFLPLFAGVCENRHAMALLRFLNNEDKFNLANGVPSVSADCDDYENDMWRGPVHIHINYMIAKGLDAYDMHDKANELKAKSLDAVMREFFDEGVFYEFYSADGKKSAKNLRRKSHSTASFLSASECVNIRDFTPTAAMILDMLFTSSKKMPARNPER